MAGTAHPLQEGGDGARGAQLADQVHVADVDAQLQGGGGHQGAQLTVLQPLLGGQAVFLGEAAVVGGDRLLPQSLGEMTGGALGQSPGIGEDQRGAVLGDELGEAVVDLLPHLVGHDRRQG